MILGSNPSCKADKARSNGIADPNTYPALPPAQTIEDVGGRDHPCIDVEGVGDPEGNEVGPRPLSSLGFDGLKVLYQSHVLVMMRKAGAFTEDSVPFASMSWVLVRPGSAVTASLSAHLENFEVLIFSIIQDQIESSIFFRERQMRERKQRLSRRCVRQTRSFKMEDCCTVQWTRRPC